MKNYKLQDMNQKTTLLSFYCLFAFALSQMINAQQIFTNGPISTGGTSTSNATAPAGYTWSELQTPNTTLGSSGYYITAGTTDFALADEFVVPTGETWTISTVDFFGYQTGYAGTTIPIDALRVRIWNGDPSLSTSAVVFGNMTASVLNNAGSSEAFVYRISSTVGTTRKIWKFNANINTTLTAGTYWIEFQVHAINDGALFVPPITILNTLSSSNWNGKIRNAATWGNLADGGSTNTLAIPFNLNGTVLANDSFEFTSSVSIFPNPTSNTLTIVDNSNSLNTSLEVIDIMGRIVKSSTLNIDSEVLLDVSDLNSGNYILRLKSEHGIAVKNFIKL